jgi:hypothetical protein
VSPFIITIDTVGSQMRLSATDAFPVPCLLFGTRSEPALSTNKRHLYTSEQIGISRPVGLEIAKQVTEISFAMSLTAS